MVKENSEERPEDVIPDTPANSAAREFLAKAPTKGLWMPLGKEVKVMKCWRCKNYGHRTGDKECPMFMTGNREAEEFRHSHEDPMYNYVKESEIRHKIEKVEMLKSLLNLEKNKKKKKKKLKKKVDHRKRRLSDSSESDTSSISSISSSSSNSSKSNKKKRKHSHRHRHHHHHKKSHKHDKHYKTNINRK